MSAPADFEVSDDESCADPRDAELLSRFEQEQNTRKNRDNDSTEGGTAGRAVYATSVNKLQNAEWNGVCARVRRRMLHDYETVCARDARYRLSCSPVIAALSAPVSRR